MPLLGYFQFKNNEQGSLLKIILDIFFRSILILEQTCICWAYSGSRLCNSAAKYPTQGE